MHIRQMVAGDISAVAAIESESLSSWTQEQIAAELERKAGISLVSISFSGEIQGWCCGMQVVFEAELLKIAVAPGWRRQGVAQSLLQTLCEQLAAGGGKQIYLEVRSLNLAARNLYGKLGWKVAGTREKYYQNPEDDAVIFVRMLVQ